MDTHAARGRLIAERERLEGVRQADDRLGAGAREAAERELSSADHHPAKLAVRHAEAELAEIDAALARLDASTYGSCEACGQPISDARLDALPAARYCVEDQAKVARARRNGHR